MLGVQQVEAAMMRGTRKDCLPLAYPLSGEGPGVRGLLDTPPQVQRERLAQPSSCCHGDQVKTRPGLGKGLGSDRLPSREPCFQGVAGARASSTLAIRKVLEKATRAPLAGAVTIIRKANPWCAGPEF